MPAGALAISYLEWTVTRSSKGFKKLFLIFIFYYWWTFNPSLDLISRHGKRDLYCSVPHFSYLHRNDATNTGNQHPSLPRGSSAQLEEALLCVPAFPAAEQWTLEHGSSSLLGHNGKLAQNASQCLTLCKSNKWAPLIVDLCWGRRHEFCRIVPLMA